jgi:SWI/SNF-related matrix-associated actin-dependent regulator of chromatin subfamily A-like protein 1
MTSSRDNIPGLNYNGTGPVDAVAVLRKREGMPLPARGTEKYQPNTRFYHDILGFRNYQNQGVSWLTSHLTLENGALLADDMGLGKTAQAIMTWASLKNPSLMVVCPGSVRESWVRQFQKWVPSSLPNVLNKGTDWDKADFWRPIITSYELAKKIPDDYYPQMVILDEAHNLKGRGAQRSRSLLSTAQAAVYRLALTGTPMWSRPRDLWMVLRILFGYRFGSANEFDVAYCNATWNKWGGKENKGVSRADELKLRLNYVMLRRLKSDVATELPRVTRDVRWVPGTKRARLLLQQSMLGRVRLHEALEATLDDKIDTVVETARDFGTNCVVFTWMKRHAMELQQRLTGEGIKTYLVTGDQSHKERDATIQRAASEKASLVCTIDSVKEGVDGIQYVTSNCIFHSIDYLPLKVAQTIARLDRIGQTEPVTAIFIAMRDSADQLVTKVVLEKLEQWRAVFGVDDGAKLSDAFSTTKQDAEMEKEILSAMIKEFES